MKKYKIMFWVATIIIFLFEGVMPALTSQSALARGAFMHLGYPIYFSVILTVFKVLGALALVIPLVPKRIKEWAYVGFGFDFLCAFLSYLVVDGVSANLILPVVMMIILVVSYHSYHKLH